MRLKGVELSRLEAGLRLSETGSGQTLLVDASIALVFRLANGTSERWETGFAYHEIDVEATSVDGLAAELAELVRDVAYDDLVVDMQLDGFVPPDDLARLPVSWEV